jgi:hypothetical protein
MTRRSLTKRERRNQFAIPQIFREKPLIVGVFVELRWREYKFNRCR